MIQIFYVYYCDKEKNLVLTSKEAFQSSKYLKFIVFKKKITDKEISEI